MEEVDFQVLLTFFKALANESRLKLVGILAQRECSVEELAALLKLKEPTVSHHLNKLKELDLVEMKPQGNTHLYKLNQDALKQLNQAIFTVEPVSIAALADVWEEKVLRSFLEDGRLKEIPASRKKRWVVLKWLLEKFEIGTLYSEKTLNEILQRYHPDSATLRREFIGYQFMQRENSVYWRRPESDWRSVDGIIEPSRGL